MRPQLWIAILAIVVMSGCSSLSGSKNAQKQAVRFLSGAYDGSEFCDPYLQYRYVGEPLHFPYKRIVLTYRHLDAYFIASMLDSSGLDRNALTLLREDAHYVLSTLQFQWRSANFHNSRRNADINGVGLDTFAILCFMTRDVDLAKQLIDGSDGEGWVDPAFHREAQAYRLLADDSWALRALAVTGVAPELLDSCTRSFIRRSEVQLAGGLPIGAEANLAIHILETEQVLRGSLIPGEASSELELLAARAEVRCRGILEHNELGGSVLDEVNVAMALMPRIGIDHPLIRKVRAQVHQQQAMDGSWRFDREDPSANGIVFTTLRCLLFLLQSDPRKADLGATAVLGRTETERGES